jgi:hypothetical protein
MIGLGYDLPIGDEGDYSAKNFKICLKLPPSTLLIMNINNNEKCFFGH